MKKEEKLRITKDALKDTNFIINEEWGKFGELIIKYNPDKDFPATEKQMKFFKSLCYQSGCWKINRNDISKMIDLRLKYKNIKIILLENECR